MISSSKIKWKYEFKYTWEYIFLAVHYFLHTRHKAAVFQYTTKGPWSKGENNIFAMQYQQLITNRQIRAEFSSQV